MKICTKRFILKKISHNLASIDYLNWLIDVKKEKLANIEGNYQSIKDLKNYIKKKTINKNILFLSIHLRKKKYLDKHIGNIKFEDLNNLNRTTTLGVLIGDKMWRNKGVFGEILGVLELYLKTEFKIKKIELGVEKINYHAIHVYKKNNFKVKKTFIKTIRMFKYLN